jgi:hypothetical protein
MQMRSLAGQRAAAGARGGAAAPRRASAPPAGARARSVRVAASAEGVQDLLARDRKRVELAPELQPAPPPPPPEAEQEEGGQQQGRGRGGRLKSRTQRRRDMAVSEGAPGAKG